MKIALHKLKAQRLQGIDGGSVPCLRIVLWLLATLVTLDFELQRLIRSRRRFTDGGLNAFAWNVYD